MSGFVAFHIETSHLICSANQMTSFFMKCNAGLKWIQTKMIILRKYHFYVTTDTSKKLPIAVKSNFLVILLPPFPKHLPF